MAMTTETPQVRLHTLSVAIDRLEEVFDLNFSQWDKLNIPSAAHYFQLSYAEIIHILNLITEEEWKEDADPELKPKFKALFKRCVGLLSRSFDYAKEAGVFLRPVHKALLSDVRRLCERRDINGKNGLGLHIIMMFNQLYDTWPPAREAWTACGNDLKLDAGFDRIFDEFNNLDNRRRKTQGDYESYARSSWNLLQDACSALHIPHNQLISGDDFFNNDTRPTYVDYPCNSEEFLYGKRDRPGILSVKSILGAPLTQDEQLKIKNATEKHNAKLSPQLSKKGPAELVYRMTQDNAVADIEDSLREIQVSGLDELHISRPAAERLITPTCENRKEILVLYKDDLCQIIEDIYTKKFKMPLDQETVPFTPEKREHWLKLAASEITTARGFIKVNINGPGSPARDKKLRLAAYRLKLSRALYVFGLLSGESDASPAEVKNALLERLEDWITHEQAWNTGDSHILARVPLSQETSSIVQQHIETRKGNIAQWREMRDKLKKSPSHNYLASNKDNKPQGQVEEDVSPVLTEEQIKTAQLLLDSVLTPKLPNASDYLLDVREERRRRDWFQKRALARLTGEPIPEWTHKRVVDPFTAGGPPGWQNLRRKTCWERLRYMWVMTAWRLYQLRELEL
ncbi:hypothetical protein GGR58DRAFT_524469 [Xylaria digitata]|nr:hypothetical protein GGR58DRAFT_524469 [Xylaria digitata]